MNPLGKLGDRPRFSMQKQTRTVYVVRWEHDGYGYDDGEDGYDFVPRRKVTQRTYFSKSAAFAWLARSMVYTIRDRMALADGPIRNLEDLKRRRCPLCEESPHDPEDGSQFCKWHEFSTVSDRITRLLKRWSKA